MKVLSRGFQSCYKFPPTLSVPDTHVRTTHPAYRLLLQPGPWGENICVADLNLLCKDAITDRHMKWTFLWQVTTQVFIMFIKHYHSQSWWLMQKLVTAIWTLDWDCTIYFQHGTLRWLLAGRLSFLSHECLQRAVCMFFILPQSVKQEDKAKATAHFRT